MVHLEEVTPGGVWDLQVSQEQQDFVAPIPVILGRAYIFRKQRADAYWIFHNEEAVGMVMYLDSPEQEAFDFCQIFIDQRYQRRGYGKAAGQLVLDRMRQDGKYQKVSVCYVEGNNASRKLFEQFGFREVRREYDEICMELTL